MRIWRKHRLSITAGRLIAAGALVVTATVGCTRPPISSGGGLSRESPGIAPATKTVADPGGTGLSGTGPTVPQPASAKELEKREIGPSTGDDTLLRLAGRGEVRIGDRESPVLHVEVARSAEERAQGLMFRRHLADDAGMVFDMESSGVWSFWMKNTLIPLDMIFIDATWRVVCVVANAAPETLTSRGCSQPSRWVLELSGGNAARYGIAAGTPLRWRPLPDAAPPKGTP